MVAWSSKSGYLLAFIPYRNLPESTILAEMYRNYWTIRENIRVWNCCMFNCWLYLDAWITRVERLEKAKFPNYLTPSNTLQFLGVRPAFAKDTYVKCFRHVAAQAPGCNSQRASPSWLDCLPTGAMSHRDRSTGVPESAIWTGLHSHCSWGVWETWLYWPRRDFYSSLPGYKQCHATGTATELIHLTGWQ